MKIDLTRKSIHVRERDSSISGAGQAIAMWTQHWDHPRGEVS